MILKITETIPQEPTRKLISGQEILTLQAGDRLRIVKHVPGQEEIFDERVPDGKTWHVVVNVHVREE